MDVFEDLIRKYGTDPFVLADVIVQQSVLRRRQLSARNPPRIPRGWRPEPTHKTVKGEFQKVVQARLTQRDLNVFAAWAECLGLRHGVPSEAVTQVIQWIAQGRIALVVFDSYEEYVAVLKALSYVRKTFATLRKPIALCVAELIRTLSLLARARYLASRPAPATLLHQHNRDTT